MSLGAVLVVEGSRGEVRAKPVEYIVTEKGCWECISHTPDTGGYPQAWRGGRLCKVHRYVYELLVKVIEEGMNLCHKRDNTICINPSHMFEGTYKDNNIDQFRKERNSSAKLTKENVLEIRGSCEDSFALASRFGVHRRTIDRVREGETYGWV